MIECIFTLDYEIYGNGDGCLRELVSEPTAELVRIFDRARARFVCFVEAAELEQMESQRSDSAIDNVRQQIKELRRDGNEIGLHLHPQWCNAVYKQGRWELDYTEYNLCRLPRER